MDKTIIGNMELQVYKGTYSLLALSEYQGKKYQIWGRKEFGKDKKLGDKSEPFKVVLGDKATALEAIKAIYKAIEADK